MAGVIATCMTNPIWLVNTRMSLGSQGSIREVVKEIYVKEGVSAFFKGLLPNIVLVVNPIINFTVYEYLK